MANIHQPAYKATLSQITQNLSQHGLQIVRSFEWQTTRATCQSHQCLSEPATHCECQLSILLVYGMGRPPITLMAHQRQEQTWFSLVNTPQQPADPELEAVITAVLAQTCGAPSAAQHK